MPHTRPIIILEDDSEDQEFLKQILEELQILNPVKLFSSAIAALEYFVASTLLPLVIISDVNLPQMNGIEFKKELNKNQGNSLRAIPFVFLSTIPDVKVITQAYELNIQGYFIKPATLKELKELLKTIVQYSMFCVRPQQ